MPVATNFRTTNLPFWTGNGAGGGGRLTNTQADQNAYAFKTAIEALQADRPQPNEIVSITSTGLSWIVTFADATQLTVPIQVLAWRWRDEGWLSGSLYQAFDGFFVEGKGVYIVNIDHTAGLTFNENLLIGGQPAYRKIMAVVDTSQSIVYDIVIYYPGVLADLPSDVPLYSERALRKFLLRASPANLHSVYLDEAPSVSIQNMTIFSGITAVGTISVAVGQNVGTVILTADATIDRFGLLSIGKPATADPVAAGLSIGLAAERVV